MEGDGWELFGQLVRIFLVNLGRGEFDYLQSRTLSGLNSYWNRHKSPFAKQFYRVKVCQPYLAAKEAYGNPARDQKNTEEMKAKPWTKALTEKLKKNWAEFVGRSKSQFRLHGEEELSEVKTEGLSAKTDFSASETNLVGPFVIIKRRYLTWKFNQCRSLVESSPILATLVRFPGTSQVFNRFIYYLQVLVNEVLEQPSVQPTPNEFVPYYHLKFSILYKQAEFFPHRTNGLILFSEVIRVVNNKYFQLENALDEMSYFPPLGKTVYSQLINYKNKTKIYIGVLNL